MKRARKRNPRRRKITDFELISHGFFREFPGCGNVRSRFKRVITSVGCCEQACYVGLIDQIEQVEGGEFDWTEVESRVGKLSTKLWDGQEETGTEKGCEVWFYYSVRYNLG